MSKLKEKISAVLASVIFMGQAMSSGLISVEVFADEEELADGAYSISEAVNYYENRCRIFDVSPGDTKGILPLVKLENYITFLKILDSNGDGKITVDEYSVEVNEENFPDDNLRRVVAGLAPDGNTLTPSILLDMESDYFYSIYEEIDFDTIKGVELFKGTRRIYMDDRNLKSVDVSGLYMINWLDLLGTPVEELNISNSGAELALEESIKNKDWYGLYITDPLTVEEIDFFYENYKFNVVYAEEPNDWSDEALTQLEELGVSISKYYHLHGDKYAVSYEDGADVYALPLNGNGLKIIMSDGEYLLPTPRTDLIEDTDAEETDGKNTNGNEDILEDNSNATDISDSSDKEETAIDETITKPAPVPETQEGQRGNDITNQEDVIEGTEAGIDTSISEESKTEEENDFVTRCYEIALGREADTEGYEYWNNQLNLGLVFGAQVGYGFIFSSEYINKNTSNEVFVEDLYLMCFGRKPDAEGYNYWMDKLSNGETRESVYAGFANSLEFYNLCSDYEVIAGYYVEGLNINAQNDINGFVSRLYTTCLNRLPDQIGQNGWVQKLANNEISGTEIARSFILSRELINLELPNDAFVERVYNALFGREADEEGKEYWVSLLEEGGTYADVLEGFTESEEFYNMCSSYGIEI
ncbi:MAG: DUF4214 domain-containing protein [Clostridia bacterium]|nr:DUF4214 domain-containing protein [Clostridia bacterium]